MKKGFTLVEIIISISLILIVGVTTTFFVFNNKRDNDLESITQEVIDAANLYISIEKDEKGNEYNYGIDNGGRGLQIPVNTLYETGYISEKSLITLENNTSKTKDELYVLVTDSINSENSLECDGNLYEYSVSWKSVSEPMYLCPIKKINEKYGNANTIIANESPYFFKGSDSKNYIKYTYSEVDYIFRIMYINGDDTLVLYSESTIFPSVFLDSELIKINAVSDESYYFSFNINSYSPNQYNNMSFESSVFDNENLESGVNYTNVSNAEFLSCSEATDVLSVLSGGLSSTTCTHSLTVTVNSYINNTKTCQKSNCLTVGGCTITYTGSKVRLQPCMKIVSGTGEETNPYILESQC